MCDSHSPILLDLFTSSDAGIFSTKSFSLLRNSGHVVLSVSIDFPSNSNRDATFTAELMTIIVLIGRVSMII